MRLTRQWARPLPAVPPGAQVSLYDLLPEDLEAWLAAQSQPAFRAKQLYAGALRPFRRTRRNGIPAVPKALGALIDAAAATRHPRTK